MEIVKGSGNEELYNKLDFAYSNEDDDSEVNIISGFPIFVS